MTFNMSEFMTENLIKTYKEGSFTDSQVSIFAANYLSRGLITQEDFEKIMNVLAGIEEEAETEPEEVVDYSSMTVADLRELAKSRGLSGYSSMTKNELIVLLGGTAEETTSKEETVE